MRTLAFSMFMAAALAACGGETNGPGESSANSETSQTTESCPVDTPFGNVVPGQDLKWSHLAKEGAIDLTFNVPVTIEADALELNNEATVAGVTETGTQHTVTVTDLAPGTEYTLRIPTGAATNECGQGLREPITASFELTPYPCADFRVGPVGWEPFGQLPAGTTEFDLTFTFSVEILAPPRVTADNGAQVASVTSDDGFVWVAQIVDVQPGETNVTLFRDFVTHCGVEEGAAAESRNFIVPE